MKELISVIVPVYNVEKYLKECLDSIINQTYTELEITVVDDGSTDGSYNICKEYEKKDRRVKVIHKENGGLSSARNAGIDNAHGKYIGFVDSDDYIASDMYERLVNACETNCANVAVCHAIVYKDGSEPIINCGYIKKDYCTVDRKIIFSNALAMSQSVCNKLFRKELFSNIRFPYNRVTEDGYIIYDLLYRARKVAYVAFGGYFYRNREDSITTRKYIERDADFVICNIRSYYRVKKIIPEIWEDGVCRAVNSGFIPVLKKIMALNMVELLKMYRSLCTISKALRYMEEDLIRTTKISEDVKEYIFTFIKSPILLYIKLKKSDVNIGIEKSERMNAYDEITRLWTVHRMNNKSVESYFANNNLSVIAIYGCGTMGELLYNEIKNSDIKVKCFIDKSADNYAYGFDDVELIKPEQISEMSEVDAVIVTPVHAFSSIRQTIIEQEYAGKIISLEEVINAL